MTDELKPEVGKIETSPSSNKKYILVAEDDKYYGKIYKAKLNKEGLDVTVAINGKLALEEAAKRKPDLMLLDLVMPVMDGFETLKTLKADPNLKTVKVVVLSNLGQDEDIQKAKDLGAADYIVKSNVSISELVAKIKTLV